MTVTSMQSTNYSLKNATLCNNFDIPDVKELLVRTLFTKIVCMFRFESCFAIHRCISATCNVALHVLCKFSFVVDFFSHSLHNVENPR